MTMEKMNRWLERIYVAVMLACSLGLFLGQGLTNRLTPTGVGLALLMLTFSGLMGISMIKEKRR